MRLTRAWRTKVLLGTAVGFSVVAVVACCKKKEEEETPVPIAASTPSVAATPEAPPPPPEAPKAGWQQKCPEAERPESGTVTALKVLQIYKAPDSTSERLSTIGPGTWVDLLGAKGGNWICIDYPTGVGQLSPGWIEVRYTQRKEPVKDAGADTGSGAKDAGAADAKRSNPIDAGGGSAPPATTTKDNPPGKAPPGGRPPVPPKK
jgi:hypothetical protein